jgi:hypothetical protein
MTTEADEIREVLMARVPATPAQMWWAREYAALMYGRLSMPGMSHQFREGALDNSVDVKIVLAAIIDGDAREARLLAALEAMVEHYATPTSERSAASYAKTNAQVAYEARAAIAAAKGA